MIKKFIHFTVLFSCASCGLIQIASATFKIKPQNVFIVNLTHRNISPPLSIIQDQYTKNNLTRDPKEYRSIINKENSCYTVQFRDQWMSDSTTINVTESIKSASAHFVDIELPKLLSGQKLIVSTMGLNPIPTTLENLQKQEKLNIYSSISKKIFEYYREKNDDFYSAHVEWSLHYNELEPLAAKHQNLGSTTKALMAPVNISVNQSLPMDLLYPTDSTNHQYQKKEEENSISNTPLSKQHPTVKITSARLTTGFQSREKFNELNLNKPLDTNTTISVKDRVRQIEEANKSDIGNQNRARKDDDKHNANAGTNGNNIETQEIVETGEGRQIEINNLLPGTKGPEIIRSELKNTESEKNKLYDNSTESSIWSVPGNEVSVTQKGKLENTLQAHHLSITCCEKRLSELKELRKNLLKSIKKLSQNQLDGPKKHLEKVNSDIGNAEQKLSSANFLYQVIASQIEIQDAPRNKSTVQSALIDDAVGINLPDLNRTNNQNALYSLLDTIYTATNIGESNYDPKQELRGKSHRFSLKNENNNTQGQNNNFNLRITTDEPSYNFDENQAKNVIVQESVNKSSSLIQKPDMIPNNDPNDPIKAQNTEDLDYMAKIPTNRIGYSIPKLTRQINNARDTLKQRLVASVEQEARLRQEIELDYDWNRLGAEIERDMQRKRINVDLMHKLNNAANEEFDSIMDALEGLHSLSSKSSYHTELDNSYSSMPDNKNFMEELLEVRSDSDYPLLWKSLDGVYHNQESNQGNNKDQHIVSEVRNDPRLEQDGKIAPRKAKSAPEVNLNDKGYSSGDSDLDSGQERVVKRKNKIWPGKAKSATEVNLNDSGYSGGSDLESGQERVVKRKNQHVASKARNRMIMPQTSRSLITKEPPALVGVLVNQDENFLEKTGFNEDFGKGFFDERNNNNNQQFLSNLKQDNQEDSPYRQNLTPPQLANEDLDLTDLFTGNNLVAANTQAPPAYAVDSLEKSRNKNRNESSELNQYHNLSPKNLLAKTSSNEKFDPDMSDKSNQKHNDQIKNNDNLNIMHQTGQTDQCNKSSNTSLFSSSKPILYQSVQENSIPSQEDKTEQWITNQQGIRQNLGEHDDQNQVRNSVQEMHEDLKVKKDHDALLTKNPIFPTVISQTAQVQVSIVEGVNQTSQTPVETNLIAYQDPEVAPPLTPAPDQNHIITQAPIIDELEQVENTNHYEVFDKIQTLHKKEHDESLLLAKTKENILNHMKADGSSTKDLEHTRLLFAAKSCSEGPKLIRDAIHFPTLASATEALKKNIAVNTSIHEVITSNINQVDNIISNRIHNIANTSSLTSLSSVQGVAAGDNDSFEKSQYGAWFMPFYSQAKQKEVGNNSGYKVKSSGGIIGIDTSLNNDLTTIGAAVSVMNSNIKYKNSYAYKTGMDSLIFSVYGKQNITEGLFMQVLASYSSIKVSSQEERIFSLGNQIANANYRSRSYSGRILFGYGAKLGNNLLLTPFIGTRYINVKNGAYTETGAQFTNRTVAANSNDRTDAIIGARLSTSINTNNGIVVIPEIHGSVSNFIKGKVGKIFTKIDCMNEPFIDTPITVKTIGSLGGNLTIKSGMLEYGLGYDMQLTKKYRGHQGNLKLRVNF